jgi:hypothetical protein
MIWAPSHSAESTPRRSLGACGRWRASLRRRGGARGTAPALAMVSWLWKRRNEPAPNFSRPAVKVPLDAAAAAAAACSLVEHLSPPRHQPSGPVKPAEQIVQQGQVKILSAETDEAGKPRQAWKQVYLALKRGGMLHCYMGVVTSNEGHKTFCGELWVLFPGDIDDFQSQGGSQHRFMVQTASGDCLYFAAHSSKQLKAWVAAFNSLPPPTVSGARQAGELAILAASSPSW